MSWEFRKKSSKSKRTGEAPWWKPSDNSCNHKSAGICFISRKESFSGGSVFSKWGLYDGSCLCGREFEGAWRWETLLWYLEWGGLLSQHMRPQRVNLISPLHLPPNPPIFLLLLLLIAILAQLVAIIHTRWNILMDVGWPFGLPGDLTHRERENRESGVLSSLVVHL